MGPSQVTIERDLQIRRKFKDVPLLWTLLELTAWYRPALAYSSVLLRGIAATVMANWSTEEGVSLVNIMALGQLLPPPLASIRDILPVLEPHQVRSDMLHTSFYSLQYCFSYSIIQNFRI